MIPQKIDCGAMKREARELLRTAQVSPRAMTALYLFLLLALDMVSVFSSGESILSTFVSILTSLMGMVLGAGFLLYCMAVRRGERSEYLTLFDGFSFVGKLIGVELLVSLFVGLWSMLFVIPGIIAVYRYRFAILNLCDDPDTGILEALAMSQRQTRGFKMQLFRMDLSYLGWFVLAFLPSLAEDFLMYRAAFGAAAAYLQNPSGGLPALDLSAAAVLPGWAWTLLSGLWLLVVALFFLAEYRCTEMGYFEQAKAVSGVGAGMGGLSLRPSDGPDNL